MATLFCNHSRATTATIHSIVRHGASTGTSGSSASVLLVFELIDAAPPTWVPMNTELGFSYEILNNSYLRHWLWCAGYRGYLAPPACSQVRPSASLCRQHRCAIRLFCLERQNNHGCRSLLINLFTSHFGALVEVIVQMTVADVFFVH
ncbi:hypothetical protein F4677DRAFT_189752 [Hypoxylon crocopeplum]|nr:hypothetical protein F4677DRAFT_189752 [Hypoxylon crocopeplum]